jgi:hypothetical protein
MGCHRRDGPSTLSEVPGGVAVAAMVECDSHTAFGELPRDEPADTAGGACHEGDEVEPIFRLRQQSLQPMIRQEESFVTVGSHRAQRQENRGIGNAPTLAIMATGACRTAAGCQKICSPAKENSYSRNGRNRK